MVLSKAQKEAGLNEYKGNIFEYLVGQTLSRFDHLESDFIDHIHPQFLGLLNLYQQKLISGDRELFRQLPHMAQATAKEIKKFFPAPLNRVELCGKFNLQHNGVADLMIDYGGEKKFVSLKLCKEGAFVNTKSGGFKSFITRYFSFAPDAEKLQNFLNEYLANSFLQMTNELLEFHGLSIQSQELHFSDVWKNLGRPDLPGALSAQEQKIIKAHYHRIISQLFLVVEKLSLEHHDDFCQSIKVLIGQGLATDITWQFSYFYREEQQVKYLPGRVQALKSEPVTSAHLSAPKKNVSFFVIQLAHCLLQIRVKPMNIFTVPSLKINCSVKY